MSRVLQPELLDTLPAEDKEAARSREDLRRVNSWMGHCGILLRALQAARLGQVHRMVELGAGDGTFALSLATALCQDWPAVELTLVDQQRLVTPRTLERFQSLGWMPRVVQADVFDWLGDEAQRADVIFANLFLHHFDETGVRRILREAVARATCFAALEPRRQFLARAGCELLWLIGCNRVTRHDARVSVQAGFRGKELTQLWPNSGDWRLREKPAGVFSHLFLATRPS
jgi:hypothetical protein